MRKLEYNGDTVGVQSEKGTFEFGIFRGFMVGFMQVKGSLSIHLGPFYATIVWGD